MTCLFPTSEISKHRDKSKDRGRGRKLPTCGNNIFDLFLTSDPTIANQDSILPGINYHKIDAVNADTSSRIRYKKSRILTCIWVFLLLGPVLNKRANRQTTRES